MGLKSVYANWFCDDFDDSQEVTLALEAAEKAAWDDLGVDDDEYEQWCEDIACDDSDEYADFDCEECTS